MAGQHVEQLREFVGMAAAQPAAGARDARVLADGERRAALRRVGGWLSRFRLISDRADMPSLVEEFARTSEEEIDYLHEAQSAERFAAIFAGDDGVGAPEVVWERTTRRVLTLQAPTSLRSVD